VLYNEILHHQAGTLTAGATQDTPLYSVSGDRK
jgi:hypothetical protein